MRSAIFLSFTLALGVAVAGPVGKRHLVTKTDLKVLTRTVHVEDGWNPQNNHWPWWTPGVGGHHHSHHRSRPTTYQQPAAAPTGTPVIPTSEAPEETESPSTESPASPTETPAATSTEAPVTPTEAPASSTDTPATTSTEAPATPTEAPASSTDTPAATSTEAPATPTEAPASSTETPASSTEAPASSNVPATTTEAPASTPVDNNGRVTGTAQATLSAGPAYQAMVIYHHNAARALHGADPLTWDDSLAANSQAWANQCQFKHNSAGQNLYAVSGEYFNVSAGIIDGWYNNEVIHMAGQYGLANIDEPIFSEVGHFTQMVWKATTAVGCASVDCSGRMIDGNGNSLGTDKYTVCDYSPPGNVVGQYAQNVSPPSSNTVLDWAA